MKQPRDDCAFVPRGKDYLLYTTDQVSYSSNLPAEAKPEMIGSFLSAINLSDIAAMAGNPEGFLASLSVPEDLEDSFIESFYRGIRKTLSRFDTELLGGDTKESTEFLASGFAAGVQRKTRVRLRKYARKGQILCVTNSLGRSAAGYVFYRSGYRKSSGIRMMLDIVPRVKEAITLSELGAKFMMDLSDGLFSAIAQMKDDYGIGFKIVEHDIPLHESVEKASRISGASPTEIGAAFGGDYELLFSIDNSAFAEFRKNVEGAGLNVSYVGELWDGSSIIFDGEQWVAIQAKGYEHFRPVPGLGRIT